MIALISIFIVAGLVFFLCNLFSRPTSKLYILDKPNERSLHSIAIPRSGGIAIFIVVFVTWLIVMLIKNVELHTYYFLLGLLLIFLISYLDDKYSVPQIWRLLTHLIAASLLVFGGLGYSSEQYLYESISTDIDVFVYDFVIILLVVWSINLYNFMDGMDGFAGGMGVIGFVCFAWLGWWSGNNLYGFMAAIIAAANLGFLVHNFPPAKIFMGDVGSISMGYLVAFFSLWGIKSELFQWWAPFLIFSPFLVDATITLMNRLFLGEKIWLAHKSHYYQRLVQYGWGHKKTVLFEYTLMVASSISVVVLTLKGSMDLTSYILIAWFLLYVVIAAIISNLGKK